MGEFSRGIIQTIHVPRNGEPIPHDPAFMKGSSSPAIIIAASGCRPSQLGIA
jgi:hypothetical protein